MFEDSEPTVTIEDFPEDMREAVMKYAEWCIREAIPELVRRVISIEWITFDKDFMIERISRRMVQAFDQEGMAVDTLKSVLENIAEQAEADERRESRFDN